MVAPILNERHLDFVMYEMFDAESMTERERYADHNRETFSAAIATAKTIAEKYFIPIRQKVDTNEPTFDGKHVSMLPEIEVKIDGQDMNHPRMPKRDGRFSDWLQSRDLTVLLSSFSDGVYRFPF